MLGRVRLADEDGDRPVRLDLLARADAVLLPHRTTRAHVSGRVRIAGRANDAEAEGELEIAPLSRRRIRYRITFAMEGRRLTLDGWKSVSPKRPLASLTVLPYTLYEDGDCVGEGTLRFPLATGLLPFLASFRFPRTAASPADRHLTSRRDGTPGRTEAEHDLDPRICEDGGTGEGPSVAIPDEEPGLATRVLEVHDQIPAACATQEAAGWCGRTQDPGSVGWRARSP
ncbi:hypothetical protein OG585_45170 [Streptomyces sp. NBC_01340]|uniref:hypothetical protein n=1 Tax=Streptomyces sp. NBC_01340 TaxID=2903830 RepID=UPI002E113E02|nr:hypothetical protein OG585_01750 [Streptomyces sp. NBC_01340]WSI43669.1 hypothetical protein OG585_45170 [Streptomyces sp. NBC_01340]